MVALLAVCAAPAQNPPAAKHFDQVIIVVFENQSYDSTIKNSLFKRLAEKGVVFNNFRNLYHYSYPNYLAMIAGSDFGVHTPLLLSDRQRNFPNDDQHRTVGDLLTWKNYAEDYPASPTAAAPFLQAGKGRYTRRHVPFLSFAAVQKNTFHNVVAVDFRDPNNLFAADIHDFIADPKKHPLPEYSLYIPNLDNDGHDPTSDPPRGLQNSSQWLRNFLVNWLHFDEQTWLPQDEALKRTLLVITYDESEGKARPERIYTVFLGAMLKPQEVTTAYDHYSVLRTIEDNFGVEPLHKDSGDGAAQVITGIWK